MSFITDLYHKSLVRHWGYTEAFREWEVLRLDCEFAMDVKLNRTFWNSKFITFANMLYEPFREYHNMEHTMKVVKRVEEFTKNSKEDNLIGLCAVKFAAFYHDAVYRVGVTWNEERSAELAGFAAVATGLPIWFSEHVEKLIMATKTHTVNGETYDTLRGVNMPYHIQSIIVADLWDLYDPRLYWDNGQKLRMEALKSGVDSMALQKGRLKWLRSFTGRETIYPKGAVPEWFEEEARMNLEHDLRISEREWGMIEKGLRNQVEAILR